jgi:hypothetical protein
MSQWRCKSDDGELGPVSFKELADLVREGKVKEGALVRREDASNWEPAWHVPGLLRAAGIVEAGDSPATSVASGPLSVESALRPPAIVPIENPIPARRDKIQNLARGIVAAAIGVLAVGFFYRRASQAALAFPMPPTVVDGELIDCYFPVIGRCTSLECGLLYVDVFAAAALATWYAAGRRLDGLQ